MKIHKTLFKRDSKGKVRIWYMEVKDNSYRTVSGLKDGKQVISSWKTCKGKNIGKVNETSPVEQAISEVESKYKDQLSKYYHESENDIDKNKIISPMLAKEWSKVKHKIDFDKSRYWTQPKLDGVRCVLTKDGAFTRTGKPLFTCEQIRREMHSYFYIFPDHVLDGELYNHEFKDDFEKLVGMIKRQTHTDEQQIELDRYLEFHVYDMIDLNNLDNLFADRLDHIQGHLYDNEFTKLVETEEVTNFISIDHNNNKMIELGYEGQMIRSNDIYKFGPSRDHRLIKRKEFFEEEYKILRVEEGQGNWAGYAKSLVCVDENGLEFGCGIRGTQDYLENVLKEKDEYESTGYASVRFPSRTGTGKPRFGVAKILWKHERNM